MEKETTTELKGTPADDGESTGPTGRGSTGRVPVFGPP
jgi:hypothetical protein